MLVKLHSNVIVVCQEMTSNADEIEQNKYEIDQCYIKTSDILPKIKC